MRHGIVAASALLLALTLGSWIIGSPATTGATTGAVAPITTTLPATTLPATTSTTAPATTVPTSSTSLPPASPARLDPVLLETTFLAELNDLRGEEGLTPFIRHDELDAWAQAWVDTMVRDGELRHSELIYEVIEATWTTAGENVGYGPTTSVIFEALVASPGHRTNMVNPDFTHVGVGVAHIDDVIWTAHLFAG